MIESALFTKLSADAGVSAVAGTRVYPLVIPQQSYDEATRQPCLVYTFSGRGRQIRFEGTGALVAGSVSIDCYAPTFAGAAALALAVRNCLKDFSGVVALPTSPVQSVEIKKAFIANEYHLTDIEPGLYRVTQDWLVWYVE